MSVFDFLFMALPVVFLIASVLIAVKAVSRGKSRKRTLMMQLASFAAVFAICMVCPFVASAASEAVDVAHLQSVCHNLEHIVFPPHLLFSYQ